MSGEGSGYATDDGARDGFPLADIGFGDPRVDLIESGLLGTGFEAIIVSIVLSLISTL